MAKTYTAQEMREEAMVVELEGYCTETAGEARMGHTIAAMLLQAADAMEREEKREKKYEYANGYLLKSGSYLMGEACNSILETRECRCFFHDNIKIFRRPVGEWEEVRDDV